MAERNINNNIITTDSFLFTNEFVSVQINIMYVIKLLFKFILSIFDTEIISILK